MCYTVPGRGEGNAALYPLSFDVEKALSMSSMEYAHTTVVFLLKHSNMETNSNQLHTATVTKFWLKIDILYFIWVCSIMYHRQI